MKIPDQIWKPSCVKIVYNIYDKVLVWSGPYYPLGTIDTVPRAYEGMEGRKNKNKEMKVGKFNTK
jgi:hypothetical protein